MPYRRLLLALFLLSGAVGLDPRVQADLARLGFRTGDDLLASFALDAAALRAFSAGAPVMTDNNPYLEFSADQPVYLPRGELPIYQELRRLRQQSAQR